jgi:cholesterol oxidase
MSELWDAIVVGSGFGGAVNALRLAEAGKSVLVLERGKRYRPGEFPRSALATDALAWNYPQDRAARGLYQMEFFSGIATARAAGVGGGSLVYASIHIRADERVFVDPRWPALYSRRMLDPYYDRVAAELEIAPLPEDKLVTKRLLFRQAAQQLGRPIFDPDQATSWTDPGVTGRQACRLCSECELGCQFGAKNTLDFNYLARAEGRGAEIAEHALVSHIAPSDTGYVVHYRHTDSGREFQARAKRIVLAAGTLGTSEILFASRDTYGTLPHVSARLGHGFSGNGDFIGTLYQSHTPIEPLHGTDVTSVMRFDDTAPEFVVAAPAFNVATLGMLHPRLAGGAPSRWLTLGQGLGGGVPHHVMATSGGEGFTNDVDAGRSTNLFAIGRDNAGGQIVRKADGALDIEWDYAGENRALVDRMQQALTEIATAYGGTFNPLPTWTFGRKIVTVHPLGGCNLSESPQAGVVSATGEVHGHPGLYVADGSVIPTSIGVHPVMTIAAVAEYIADGVVASLD